MWIYHRRDSGRRAILVGPARTEDAPPTFAAFGASLATGSGYNVIYRLKVKDGSYRWFRATGGVIMVWDGKPRRACGSLVDIHDAKSTLDRVASSFKSEIWPWCSRWRRQPRTCRRMPAR